MAEKLAEKMRRRGFPVGITITRDGPYGATSSRLVVRDELSEEKKSEYDRGIIGFPCMVEADDLVSPASPDSLPASPSVPTPHGATESRAAEIAAPDKPSAPISEPVSADESHPSTLIRLPEPELPPPALDPGTLALPPDFSRHARRCLICAHPERDAIEGDFIRWNSPRQIAKAYQLADRASIYRHAHSTGLFERRKREVGRVLESVLENVDQCPVDKFDTIIRAARLYTRLDDNGVWSEPPRITYFIAGPPPDATAAPRLPQAQRKTRGAKSLKLLTATHPNSKKRPNS